MNRRERRIAFKGFAKMAAVGSYADLTPGFERDMMVAICKAVTPGRGDIIMPEEQIVEAVFHAIRRDALDVWFRWTDNGAEVKTELRVPFDGAVRSMAPVSTHILFEDVAA